MRGQYLVQSLGSYAAIWALDVALRMLPVRRRCAAPNVRKILVANWAHAGDVVLTLPAVATLRCMFPRASVAMLVGSWARGAVESAGVVEKAYYIDHWALNREGITRYDKTKRYWSMRVKAVRAIRGEQFDMAIDFYPFFPPAHPLFYAAGIPIRIGFVSGGFGHLLTHPIRWENSQKPMIECHLDLLRKVFQQRSLNSEPAWKYQVSAIPHALCEKGWREFVVVHPGAGAQFKEWDIEKWCDVIRRLEAAGEHVVITGVGQREADVAKRLMTQADGVLNLVGRTSWQEFLGTIAHARGVICTDSVAGHVAAMYEVPTVSIFTGTNDITQWAPRNSRGQVLVKDVRCSPCHRPGCAEMRCIQGVTVEAVIAALREIVLASQPQELIDAKKS